MTLELAKRVSGDVTIIDLRGRCTLGDETEDLSRELKTALDGGCRTMFSKYRDGLRGLVVNKR